MPFLEKQHLKRNLWGSTLEGISRALPNVHGERTGTSRYIHGRAFLVPEISVNCRSDGKRFCDMVFQFIRKLICDLRWDSTLYCVTCKVDASIANSALITDHR